MYVYIYMTSLVAQRVKNLTANAEDLGSIPGSQRSPEVQNGNPGFSRQEYCGQRSLSGYSPWGRKESDTTERLSTRHIAQGPTLTRFNILESSVKGK